MPAGTKEERLNGRSLLSKKGEQASVAGVWVLKEAKTLNSDDAGERKCGGRNATDDSRFSFT